ncbi:MAG: protein kinase [Gemmatimonadetes bacterium]|nr:protein kinase [Gemmatimonadota bacterium]
MAIPDDHRARLQAALGRTYTIERELGGGGMSRVYVAREVGLNREVVVKVLPDDVAAGVSLERFTREIQLAASLQQANIVPLLATGEADGVPYFTMPFVEGESLRARLRATPRLTVGECVNILRDVARALSYAHARGIVHRDIKPDNVLLSHGAAVVTDFGIAKAVSASRTVGGGATLTQAGTSIGTPAYMAPEQVAGDPDVGAAADLYSWGCLAYELLAGEPPFVRESMQRVMAAHLAEAPAPLATRRAEVPASLARLVMRCLEKEPSARPASADEVLRELDAVFTPGAAPSMALPSETSARASAKGTGGRRAWIAFGVLAIAVASAIMVLRGRARGAPGASADASAPNRAIAVLPLANLGGDKADDYFGIGLAEEITRALTQTGVKVIGRVSAGALAARGMDERAIAKELGVGAVLTGSVQRGDGQVRINVSLLDAADGAVKWSDKYDRPVANLFALQDEIARAVATKLLGTMGGASQRVTKVETKDPEAYALFLQGQVLFNRRTAETLQQAISVFEQVLRRDPQFARARAMLAMTQSTLPSYTSIPADSAYPMAFASAERAVAMDSLLAEAYTAEGYVSVLVSRNRQGDSLFRRALAIDSTVATTWGWYALLASHMGDDAEAVRRVRRARALEPASLIARVWEGQIHLAARRYALADSLASDVLARDSSFGLATSLKAQALVHGGRASEAIPLLERMRAASMAKGDSVRNGDNLTLALARAGRVADARAFASRLRAQAGGRYPATGMMACALDAMGDRAAALETLERAVDVHEPWMLQYGKSACFDPLRADPRGKAILARTEQW